MKLVLFIILLIPFFSVYGQNLKPGGVQGATVWEVTEYKLSGQAQWKCQLESNPDSALLVKGSIKTINNNPALFFNKGQTGMNSTLNLGKLESFSLFTVCQANDTISERVIFSLENNTAAEMVLTDRRMAALDVYRYANFNSNIDLYPKIYSYTQNKSKDTDAVSRRLLFGRYPGNQHLPVSAYNGIVPEVILFNRFISPIERQKVESYLALKYGISLNQAIPVSYLNSKGEVIWDSEMNAGFNQNIAGIGRDDMSGLNQRISESTQTPGLMKIGIRRNMKNNSFLVWGDNGKAVNFGEEAGIRKLQRDWKVSTFNYEGDSIYFETNELSLSEIDPLNVGDIYWMMIDKTGTGKYPFRQTRFIPCLPLSSSPGFIRFSSLILDTDISGNDVLTLLAAPSFFARCTIQSPSCTSTESGAILTEIAGGEPPFMLSLKGITNKSFQISTMEKERDHFFDDISQGSYFLQVTDAANKTYTQEIWVSNMHLWESNLIQRYKLAEGETLNLNAADGMPAVSYYYKWETPDGSVIHNEEISISQPGNYLLSVTDDKNCNSTLAIKIEQIGKTLFKKVELFPNPVNGWFIVRMSLERRADVKVIISDLSGIILKETLLQNDQYYLYNDIIPKPGIYFITLVSGNEKETLRLIVQ